MEERAFFNIYPGDFQQKWPLHVTKNTIGQEFKWLNHENKTTISDIPLRFRHINNHYVNISVPSKSSLKLCLISRIRSKIRLFLQLLGHRGQDLHYFLIIWPPNVPTTNRLSSANSHDQWPVIMSPFQSLSSLMMCFWHGQYFKPNGVLNIGVCLKLWHRYHFVAYILPLQAIDAYILPMCLKRAVPTFWGDSQIFQLLPSLAYSVSRDRFILVNLHHMPGYPFLSRE